HFYRSVFKYIDICYTNFWSRTVEGLFSSFKGNGRTESSISIHGSSSSYTHILSVVFVGGELCKVIDSYGAYGQGYCFRIFQMIGKLLYEAVFGIKVRIIKDERLILFYSRFL